MLRLFLLLFCFNFCFANPFDDIKFMTEIYPPYNYVDKYELKGIAVDILLEALKEVKSKQTLKDIQVLPWVRGYSLAQLPTERNVIFSTTRTKEREVLFKWVGPIKPINIDLIALKKRKFKIEKEDEIPLYTYTTIRGDVAELLLGTKGVKGKQIADHTSFKSVLQFLFNERADMLAYSADVAHWLAKKYDYDTNKLETIYTMQTSELYFAFNRSISDAIVDRFQEAVTKVTSNKQFMRDLDAKYLK